MHRRARAAIRAIRPARCSLSPPLLCPFRASHARDRHLPDMASAAGLVLQSSGGFWGDSISNHTTCLPPDMISGRLILLDAPPWLVAGLATVGPPP